jgi:imidazolonepropionase-like amidohydrolase
MLPESVASLSRKLVYLEPGTTTVLSNVRLVDGTGAAAREAVTLTIQDDRIQRIEHSTSTIATPPGAHIIDGTGMTVIPGLIDCHIHFTGEVALSAIERYSPDVWRDYRGIMTVWDVARALEAGVTTCRALGHGVAGQVYGLRRAVAEGLIQGPRILTCGWSISQTGGHGDPHFLPQEVTRQYRPRSAFADGPVECRRLVRQNFGEGADCIKIFATEGSLVGAEGPRSTVPNFTLEEIQAMTDEAHIRGARVAAHATTAEGVRNAILGGVDTIEHGGPLGDTPDLLQMLVERGCYLVPTLKIYEVIVTEGERLGVRPKSIGIARDLFKRQKGYLREALDMGVRIAMGTDTALFERGDNARELGLLVESGFSPMQAIVAATRVSAHAIGLEEHLGTLEIGKVAELLVLTEDPLRDIHSLRNHDTIRWIFKSRDQLN